MTLPKHALLCGALAALALPAAAWAQASAAPDNDARCLAMSMVLSSSSDATARNIGPQGVVYYLGRVDARPRGNLKARLTAQFTILTAQPPAVVSAAAQSCMQEMVARGRAFHPIADYLAQRFGKPVPTAAPAAPAPAAPAVPPPAH